MVKHLKIVSRFYSTKAEEWRTLSERCYRNVAWDFAPEILAPKAATAGASAYIQKSGCDCVTT